MSGWYDILSMDRKDIVRTIKKVHEELDDDKDRNL